MKKIRMMMAAALAILASCSTTKSGESTAKYFCLSADGGVDVSVKWLPMMNIAGHLLRIATG